MVAFVLSLSVSAADDIISATSAWSSHTGTYDKKSYSAVSYLYVTYNQYSTGSSVQATTQINANGYTNCPAGYMGAQAKLYNDSGSLVQASTWVYNSGNGNALLAYYSKDYPNSKGSNFYSQGAIALYNGNGYSNNTTNRTPSLTLPMSVTLDPFSILPANSIYGINEAGQTYGSELYTSKLIDAPDLVAAVGVNGIEGYVYADDLMNAGRKSSPEDNDIIGDITISLYDEDGQTVIDEFVVLEGHASNWTQ